MVLSMIKHATRQEMWFAVLLVLHSLVVATSTSARARGSYAVVHLSLSGPSPLSQTHHAPSRMR